MLRKGFTLLEVVLAIAISSALLYLLLSAVELYLLHEDTNRVRVESAQLARALLDQIAADLQDVSPPSPERSASGGSRRGDGSVPSGGGGGRGGGGSGAGGAGGGGFSNSPSSSGGPPLPTDSGSNSEGPQQSSSDGPPLAVSGTPTELWIARTAPSRWSRATTELLPQQATPAALMPLTTRYLLVDGVIETSLEHAARGIETETRAGSGGLFRETLPTAAATLLPQGSTVDALGEFASRELLAPEAVSIEFAYYDGSEMLEAWEADQQSGLPVAVEIRLTLLAVGYERSLDRETLARYREGRYGPEDVLEYRRFVRLPKVSAPRAEQDLVFPQAGNGAGGGGQPGGAGPGGSPGSGPEGEAAGDGAPGTEGRGNGR